MKSNMKKFLAFLLALSLVLVPLGDVTKVKAANNINVTLTGLHGNTAVAGSEIVLWLTTSGGTWEDNWDHTWEPFVYEVNGVEKKVNIVQSAGTELLYVTIPIVDVAPTAGNKITIKKGEYPARAIPADPTICLQNDFEIVFTCDGPVADAGYKIFDVGSATIAHGTANEIQVDLKDKEGNPITFGKLTTETWNVCTLVPANKSGSRTNNATEWSASENGVFQGETHINYWPAGGFDFQEINTGRFRIGGLSATEGTVVTVKGAFAAMDGGTWVDFDKCIFKEFSFTYTNGTWVFSKPYQDVTITSFLYGTPGTLITETEVQLWLNIDSGEWSSDNWTDWKSEWYKFVYEINGVKKNVAIVQAAGTNLLFVTIPLSDITTEAGTKITIKAGEYPAYQDTNKGINLLRDFDIVFTCDAPVVAEGYKIFEVGNTSIANGTANEIQVDLKDKEGNPITFGKHTTEVWNVCTLVPANKNGFRTNNATEWSASENGVFQGDSHINYWPSGGFNFQEINTGRFRIGGLEATEGTVVTIKGAFATMDGGSWVDFDKCIFKEFSFTYTNGTWVSSVSSTEPEPTYTEYTGAPELQEWNSNKGFYFLGNETYETTEFPYDTGWSIWVYAIDEDESGVFLNGDKTTAYLKKVDTGRWYVDLEAANVAPEDGDEITIAGTFVYDTHRITFDEATFEYETPEAPVTYQGTPVLSAQNGAYGTVSGFYFTSEDGAPYAEDWSLWYQPQEGDSNGVFVGDTKYEIGLQKVNTNLWYANLTTDSNLTLDYGDVVTIKGAFETSSGEIVTFNEAKFQFNGKQFSEGTFTATDFTITGLAYSDIVYDTANSRWNMYFTLSNNIPGDVDVTYFPYMTYEIDGTEYTAHWFKASSAHTVNEEVIYNLYVPITELPKTLEREYVITIKASASQGRQSGSNVARADGINLTADYQFTVGGHYEATAPTIDYLESTTGGTANGIYLASSDNFPTIGWDYSLTKAGEDDGVYKRDEETGEYVATDVFIKKFNNNKYYVCLSDVGENAEEGTVIMLRGTFTTKDLNFVTFKTAKYIYQDSTWKVYSDIQIESGTGVSGDADKSGKLNCADLVRMKKFLEGSATVINLSDADLNGSGKIDVNDIVIERKLLVGLELYKGAPTYADNVEMRLAAYVSPTVEEGFDDYKAAGFTTLISEQRAVYGEEGFAEYMNLAAEKGLDVIVQSGYFQNMLTGEEKYNATWIQNMYNDLSKYSSFRGMFMGDEPRISYLDNYTTVTNALKQIDPNMDLFVSCLQTYTNEEYLSTNNTLSLEQKYVDYANSYGNLLGEFTYDFYPFKHSYKAFLGMKYDEKDYMRSDWFNNLNLVASNAKGSYDTGITVQSYSEELNAKDHYREVSQADVSFQVYSALAYGMKSINYFTYGTHWDEGVGTTSCMVYNGTKTDTYYAVQNVNKEIKALDHILLNYNWQGTIGMSGDNADGIMNYVADYTSPRISASSATNDAIIGCLKDQNGYDGFMLVNATDPSDNKSATVSITFNDADHAKVYIGGEESIVELKDGAYSATLTPGQGIFVIPYIH